MEISILALSEDVSSVDAYCLKYVYPLGVDAEGTLADLGVLFRALRCRGVTVLVDAMASLKDPPLSLKEEAEVKDGKGAEGGGLPPGWKSDRDKDGIEYFYSAAGVTQWERPLSEKEAARPLTVYASGDTDCDAADPGALQSLVDSFSALFTPSPGPSPAPPMSPGMAVLPGKLGTIHLMLRAGKGMGEGHYDLLYLRSAPVIARFQALGSQRLYIARLPVPPLSLLNHVHSVAQDDAGSRALALMLTPPGPRRAAKAKKLSVLRQLVGLGSGKDPPAPLSPPSAGKAAAAQTEEREDDDLVSGGKTAKSRKKAAVRIGARGRNDDALDSKTEAGGGEAEGLPLEHCRPGGWGRFLCYCN